MNKTTKGQPSGSAPLIDLRSGMVFEQSPAGLRHILPTCEITGRSGGTNVARATYLYTNLYVDMFHMTYRRGFPSNKGNRPKWAVFLSSSTFKQPKNGSKMTHPRLVHSKGKQKTNTHPLVLGQALCQRIQGQIWPVPHRG